MAEVASAYVSLLPSAQGFGSKLDSEISGDIKKSGSNAGKVFGKLFGLGAGLLAGAGLKSLFSDSIGEAREAQKVGAATEQIIKSTGKAAGVTADQVGTMAGRLSSVTGIDDEVIQQGSNLLLTFKNVKNYVDGEFVGVFDRATKAAVDLSAAGFGSVDGAAKMLGKALNDPLKGVSALGRAGVTFSEDQKALIKSFVDGGDAAKAQALILKEVESQVGGVAKATATSGEKASVAMGNLKEQIGTALLPTVDKLSDGFTTKVAPAISDFVTGMQTGEGAGGQFAAGLTSIANGLKSAGSFIKSNSDVLIPLVAAYAAGAIVLKTITAVTKAYAAAQAILNAVMATNPLTLVVVAVAALAAGLIIAYKKSETFRSIVDGAFSKVESGASALADTVKVGFAAIGVAIDAVGKAGTFLWNKALQPAFKFIVNGVAGLMDIWADMLGVLGNVPGFGWAKDASKAMADAAKTARDVADGITKIPNKKDVAVVVTYTYKGLRGPGGSGPTRGGKDDFAPRLGLPTSDEASQFMQGYGDTAMTALGRGINKGAKKTREQLTSILDKMKDRLSALKDDFAAISDSVSSAFTGNLFEAVTASDFIANLTAKKGELGGLLASFKTLQGWGIPASFLSQLFASGNGALITELAGMGQAGASSAASLFGDVTSLGTQLGNAVATNDLGPNIDKVATEIKGLREDIKNAPKETGKEAGRETARILTNARFVIEGNGRGVYLRTGGN